MLQITISKRAALIIAVALVLVVPAIAGATHIFRRCWGFGDACRGYRVDGRLWCDVRVWERGLLPE